MPDKVSYMLFDAEGVCTQSGNSPDGTLPAGAVEVTPEQAFEPNLWRYVGGQVVPAPFTVADLVAYANAHQWTLATGGLSVAIGGQVLRFATDPQSQALIIGKAVRFGLPEAPASVDWQFADGFVTLQAADFMAAATDIADFVQATFDALKAVLDAAQAGTIATAADVDAYAWPANGEA